jgi:aspartate carbamoyltransferase catalytic subunit
MKKDLVNIKDLSNEEIMKLFVVADEMNHAIQNKQKLDLCKGKILATLFYEASTRTRLSFESAMFRLGGSVLGFSSTEGSSVSKGESLADTIRTVASYSDVIAIRHPNEGSARVASQFSQVPIINGGDGGHQHPTQTLLDLYTILKEKGSFDNLSVLISGDLKFGRTTHSLAISLARFGVKMCFASPPGLEMPDYIMRTLSNEFQVVPKVANNIRDFINDVDVIYVTRVQRERLGEMEYLKYRDAYVVSEEMLRSAKKDAIVLHPLPRVNEIARDVDKDPRALYFKQAYNGVPVRMALIATLLGVI